MFEQDRVLVRLQQRVMSEGDIVACFLAGSYGRYYILSFMKFISIKGGTQPRSKR